ncbi:MAG: thiamine pyrophosphate-dependent enzyme [Archaeoglobaceae archaeon]|nr:thiamine pyrophosphate-dependent enzyme [Archaeoglobaceae archaeon]
MKEHEYRTDAWIQWCPGCGNYGILSAIKKTLAELDICPRKLVIVSGIGCSSRIVYYIRGSNVHTVHGRAIPVASGIKLANPELTVLVAGGDGDLLGIGAGHFIALGRRNVDIKVLIHDNSVYGLTKGQAGPTLPLGVKLKAMNYANVQEAVNPLLLAYTSGYTFIARAYAYHITQLKDMIREAILHKGSAVIDILQPCITYNDLMTREWFEKRIYYLQSIPDSRDFFHKLMEEDKIPLGIFLRVQKETFEDRMKLVRGKVKG